MVDSGITHDHEILAKLRSGSGVEEAVKAIYCNHYKKLTGYILQNNGNKQDAEDIFQEVVLAFIELVKLNKFREESSIYTFLFSINRHTWLNELKRRGRALYREEKYEEGIEKVESDVGQFMEERDKRVRIASLVDGLGGKCRQILLAFYFEKKSIKEILYETGYDNEQVVRNKKYLCLKQLEQKLNENPTLKQILKGLLYG
ncbi:MAG: sigma-70 family RNA polymerase sigma factor [Chitinophagales bacterium]|nr:sigma-70 family RNA polymerase sigma factor [Chitinophagales bacterium]